MGIQIGPLDLSPTRRTPIWSDGGKVAMHKTPLLVPEPGRAITPNAFLVEQPPGSTIRSHFHVNSQWQVFVGGSGHLGRRPVQGFVAQYVAAHTGYGPIVAGDHGLWYLTLRPSAPSGARYLPDERAALDMSLPKRQVTSEQFGALPEAGEATVQDILAPQADGLAAWMMGVPAGRTVLAPEHPGGLARYHVVASGSLRVSGSQLGPLGLVWADGDAINLPLEAGPHGAHVIVLQFPGDSF